LKTVQNNTKNIGCVSKSDLLIIKVGIHANWEILANKVTVLYDNNSRKV